MEGSQVTDQELRADIVQILFKLSDWMDPLGGAEEAADVLFAKYDITPKKPKYQ